MCVRYTEGQGSRMCALHGEAAAAASTPPKISRLCVCGRDYRGAFLKGGWPELIDINHQQDIVVALGVNRKSTMP